MSQALWCDARHHAFSANDPDRESIQGMRSAKGADGRRYQESVTHDICGPCAAKSHEAPAIEGSALTSDPVSRSEVA